MPTSAQSTTLNLSEIEKQQQELERRAAELDRREQNLNAPAGAFGKIFQFNYNQKLFKTIVFIIANIFLSQQFSTIAHVVSWST